MRPVILFVDDEVEVLEGLRRCLIDQEDQWKLLFTTSAADALEVMEKVSVDVVVTDMRMPGMDGAALLDEVRQRHPGAGRFILSGFSQRETLFRTLGPAHQYFGKPCDSKALVQAIERTVEFRRRLNTPDLLALIAGATAVPVLPKSLIELFEELQSPDGSIASVTRIISADIALTAQVLKLVNSAYFFLAAHVSDVLHAVRLLGFDLIRSIATLAGVFSTFRSAGIDFSAVQRLEERSLSLGAVARRIATIERLEPALVSQCQCAGMLAHVGSLVLFSNRPDGMARLRSELDTSGGNIIEAEKRYFGASHAEVGACLLGLWGFTDTIVEAVLCHHAPSTESANSSDVLGPTAIVHAAQYLVKTPPVPGGGLDHDYLARVNSAERISLWAEETVRTLKACSP